MGLTLTDDVDPECLAELWAGGELALEVALVLRLHEPHLQRPVPLGQRVRPPVVEVAAVEAEADVLASLPEELEAGVVDEADVADVEDVRVLPPHPRHLKQCEREAAVSQKMSGVI